MTVQKILIRPSLDYLFNHPEDMAYLMTIDEFFNPADPWSSCRIYIPRRFKKGFLKVNRLRNYSPIEGINIKIITSVDSPAYEYVTQWPVAKVILIKFGVDVNEIPVSIIPSEGVK